MGLYLYKLNFTSSLHLGTEGIGQEKIESLLHSDTLYNAIIINWSLIYDDRIEDIAVNPLFKISSAFPFIGNKLFFPAPLGIFDKKMEDEKEDLKFWKKLEWIPEETLRSYLKKGVLEDSDYTELKKFFDDSKYFKKNKLNFGFEEERPRVTVDRVNNSSDEYFHSRDFAFKNNSGLFFLIDFDNEKLKQKFDASLSLLGDNGIGADRSIGKGLFDYTVGKIDFKIASEKDKSLLLSLYFPLQEEIENDLLIYSDYKLKERFGYIGWINSSGKKRNKIRMLAEGSVLNMKGRLGGSVVKVASVKTGVPYDVYRNGEGFLLKIEGGENG